MRTKTENVMRYMPTGETYTVDLYEFHELSDDAQARIIDEYDEERQNDPYFSQWFADFQEHEIWTCVHDLEKSITGARVQWRYNRWYSCDFDCEYAYDDCYTPYEVNRVDDTGYYASMDLCDAWNAHVRKLNAICYHVNYLESLMYGEYDVWGPHYVYLKYNETAYNRLETMRDHLIDAWYAELEAACEDVRNTIETLLRVEWEDYTSKEYARGEFEANEAGYECRTRDNSGRVFYSDSRKWYTVDGKFCEQGNVSYECVSIVKAS